MGCSARPHGASEVSGGGRHDNITDVIGATPVVRLRRVGRGATLWAKLEGLGPGGGQTDRTALAMLQEATRAGKLPAEGGHVLVADHSDFAVSLAMCCAARLHSLTVVAPEGLSHRFRSLLAIYGARLVETPFIQGSEGARRLATNLANPGNLLLSPDVDPAGPLAHFRSTGPELATAFEEGGLDALVVWVQTGASLTGLGRLLRRRWPSLLLIGVELASDQRLAEGSLLPPPGLLDRRCMDRAVAVPDGLARQAVGELARGQGILTALNGGAVYAAARSLAGELDDDRHICFLLPSHGERELVSVIPV
jgi:cysteine synthase